MRDAILLGSGRSGTSMLAGTLARAGWFSGARPYPPRSSNPKGFFESPDVNGVNEALLADVLPARPAWRAWQRWLAIPDAEASYAPDDLLAGRMAALAARRPFAFKDPRFCWTLPAWEPFLDDALRVCIFRDPAVTARSIVKECRQAEYLAGVPMSLARGLEVWRASYAQVLRHVGRGTWLFLHYDQLVDGTGLPRLEAALGAEVDRDFPDGALRRTRCEEPVPAAAAELYDELCARASYEPERRPAVLAPAAPATADDGADAPAGGAAAPELSVILATGPDEARARRALAALERQTAPAGSFEVLRCAPDAADRNRALEEARGRRALLLDDDLAAAPTLVEEHLRAHRTLGDRKISVRGTTEPAAELPSWALTRYLTSVGELLTPAAPEREVGKWTLFRTNNLSVSLEALRAVGGFDATFETRAVRDAALGLALEGLGYLVAFHAGARATWRGELRLEDYRGARRALAASTWRLIARHPQALHHRSLRAVARVDAETLEEFVDDRLPMLAAWRDCAEALAHLDLYAIDSEGRETDGAAAELENRFATALRELDAVTWRAELAAGLRASGASCLAELGLPWHLETGARRRWLAWPRYDSALDLDVLMTDWTDALARDADACLCLRCDPRIDPPLAEAQAAVEAAYARHQDGEASLEVLFVAEPLAPGPWLRLGQSIDGVLRLPSGADGDRADALAALGVPVLGSPAELPAAAGARVASA